MLKIIENPIICKMRGVDGFYAIDTKTIVVSDRENKQVLVHEISHYLWDIGDTEYLDTILSICDLFNIDFWDVVDVEAVSEMVDDYEWFIDECCAYFMEQVFLDFPELVLESNSVFSVVLGKE